MSTYLDRKGLKKMFDELEKNDGPTPPGALAYRFIRLSPNHHNPNKIIAFIEEAIQDHGYDAVKEAIEEVGPEALSFPYVITHLRKKKKEKEEHDKLHADVAKLREKEERRSKK